MKRQKSVISNSSLEIIKVGQQINTDSTISNWYDIMQNNVKIGWITGSCKSDYFEIIDIQLYDLSRNKGNGTIVMKKLEKKVSKLKLINVRRGERDDIICNMGKNNGCEEEGECKFCSVYLNSLDSLEFYQKFGTLTKIDKDSENYWLEFNSII